MATILIEHPIGSGTRYILLGAGYGVWSSSRPSLMLGNWSPTREGGQSQLLCVCDAHGAVHWVPVQQARVVSVGGMEPGVALGAKDEG